MAGFALSRVINGDFLRRFASLASSSQPASQALNGAPGVQQSLGAGLRVGARTYSTALDGLNSAVSFVNLSEDTLKKLSRLTDKLIEVTQRATDIATSSTTREKLDVEFKQYANEFKQTVKGATTGDNEFLTAEGLEEVFRTIGLDKDSSRSIAEIFSQFVTTTGDDSLASENIRGGDPNIPIGAFRTRLSDAQFLANRMGQGGVGGGQISTVNTVYYERDTVLGQNPSYNSWLATDTNGSTNGLSSGVLSADITVLAVDEITGYSVIQSTDSLSGDASYDGFNNLYLVSDTGAVLHRYTDNTSLTISYLDADISSSLLQIVYSEDNGATTTATYATFAAFGGGGVTVPLTVGLEINKVAMSNGGTFLAYRDNATTTTYFYSVAGNAFHATVQSTPDILDFGFLEDGSLAVLRDGVVTRTVQEISFLGAGFTTLASVSGDANKFATLEGSGFAVFSDIENEITQYDLTGDLERTLELGVDDEVSDLSLALNRNGTSIDVGVYGALHSFGSIDKYMYRFRDNPAYSQQQPSARGSPALYESITEQQNVSIFDSSFSIADRPQAYRTLKRLEALKDQIEKNLGALDAARTSLEENIELIRAAGTAFLELSNQVRGPEDADDLARKLILKIRNSSSAALSQADNLNAITVAALTQQGD